MAAGFVLPVLACENEPAVLYMPLKLIPGVRCTTTVTVIDVTGAVLPNVNRFSKYQGGLPPTAVVTVTPPLPPPLVLNVAVTERACVIDTVQPAVPVQAPLQPANVEPAAAVAVSVTLVPFAKLAFCVVQVGAQLMPAGLDVTVPVPVPALLSVSVCVLATVLAWAMTVRGGRRPRAAARAGAGAAPAGERRPGRRRRGERDAGAAGEAGALRAAARAAVDARRARRHRTCARARLGQRQRLRVAARARLAVDDPA